MPQDFDLDDDIDLDDEPDNDPNDRTPKALREAAKAGKQAKAEAARLARENVMLKAGVDTDSPLGKIFAAGYDGELTKDAVKAAYAGLGVAPVAAEPADPAPENPDPVLADGEAGSTAERQALANGAPADQLSDKDPRTKSIEDAHAVIAKGGTSEAAIAASFATRVAAAAAGDKRVILEGANG